MRERQVRDESSATVASGRVGWIDTGRGLAIVLVVLFHSTHWIVLAGASMPVWIDLGHVLATLRMPLFFTCSGILAVKWITAPWDDVVARKVTALMWVYLLWQPVGSGVALVAAEITGDQLTLFRMIGSLALSPIRPRFELWFLWALALFFVLARASARFPRAPQIAVAGVLSAVWFAGLVPETNLGWDGAALYYVFFLFGCHYRALVNGFAERLGFKASLLLIGAWFVISITAFATGLDHMIGTGLLIRVIGVAAGIALALRLHSVTVLSYLGSRTLPIYVAHAQMITCIAWLLSPILNDESPSEVLAVFPLLLTVATVTLTLLLQAMLSRNRVGAMFYAPPALVVDRVHQLFSGRPPRVIDLRETEASTVDVLPGETVSGPVVVSGEVVPGPAVVSGEAVSGEAVPSEVVPVDRSPLFTKPER